MWCEKRKPLVGVSVLYFKHKNMLISSNDLLLIKLKRCLLQSCGLIAVTYRLSRSEKYLTMCVSVLDVFLCEQFLKCLFRFCLSTIYQAPRRVENGRDFNYTDESRSRWLRDPRTHVTSAFVSNNPRKTHTFHPVSIHMSVSHRLKILLSYQTLEVLRNRSDKHENSMFRIVWRTTLASIDFHCMWSKPRVSFVFHRRVIYRFLLTWG